MTKLGEIRRSEGEFERWNGKYWEGIRSGIISRSNQRTLGDPTDVLKDLRARACEWHARRFPDANTLAVALKLCEEAGEVGRAVNGLVGTNSPFRGGPEKVTEELADVMVVSLVLLGRYFPEQDLLAAVDAKLALLEDPNSGHRSAALEERKENA